MIIGLVKEKKVNLQPADISACWNLGAVGIYGKQE